MLQQSDEIGVLYLETWLGLDNVFKPEWLKIYDQDNKYLVNMHNYTNIQMG